MKSQHERLARVGERGVLDKDSVEEALYGFEAAEAGLQEVESKIKSAQAARDESAAKLSKARADVIVAEAHLAVAKENRDHIETLLKYTKITAPFDGIVTRRNINTGDFVQPATTGKGEPLYVVERRDQVRIFVEVPETDADWVKKGAKAHVQVQALKDQEFAGEIARTSYSLDRKARTLLAEIDLKNLQDRLRPGMYAFATITADYPAPLALPSSAVATQGDVTQGYQSYCFVVEGEKAVRVAVQVGRSDGQLVEVLKRQKSGPTPAWEDFNGNEVVVAKAAGVTDGQMILSSTPAK